MNNREVFTFDPTTAFHARTSDPETSRHAETRIRTSDKAGVWQLFIAAGLRGLTDRELQAACPESTLPRLESFRNAHTDLVREGELVETAERRGGQIVWIRYASDRLF